MEKEMRTPENNSIRRRLAAAIVESLDARLLQSASIVGSLINDANANYAWDAGDTRNVNWQVYLDANANAQFDNGEMTRQTDYNGAFEFLGLEPGNYVLRQVLPEGWRPTFPRNLTSHEISLVDGQSARVEFGSTQAISSISGVVFNDANADGVRGNDEAIDAFRTVYFDENNNGRDDPGERWTVTTATGAFSFSGLPGGEYRIRLAARHGWTQTFGGDSALAVVNGRSAVAGLQFAHTEDAAPTSYDVNRLMSFILIGGSSTVAADRRVAWNIQAEGWTGFVETYVQPQLDWGIRRIMLHNPFGNLPGEIFLADQAIHAREAGLNWLLDDFVAAWQPIVAQGVEVIAYMGTPRNSPGFDGLEDQAWWDRVHDSFALPMAAGMNIGLDMSLAINPGDREWTFIEELRTQGLDVYGEPRPPATSTHWTSGRLFAEESIWQYTNPETNPDTFWAARDSQITGEVTRLLSYPPEGETWQTFATWGPETVNRILREGHTAAFGVSNMIDAGITLSQLLTDTAPRIAPLSNIGWSSSTRWGNIGNETFSNVVVVDADFELSELIEETDLAMLD